MELSANIRQTTGSKVKKIREIGKTPGVVYSTKSSIGKADVLNIEVDTKELVKIYKLAGESTLVELDVNGSRRDVLFKNVQVDPISYKPLHVSFFEVDMSQPIETEIPVILINEDQCAPVKDGSGILIQVIDSIKVKCLPKFIPQKFEIDVSVLKNVEDVLTIGEAIKITNDKVEILDDTSEALVKVDFAEQKEAEAEPTSVSDVDVITAKEESDSNDPKATDGEKDQ